ncbi:MAG TPA: hypothetical protein VGQ83_24750 [Polyangia bacterium]
MAESIDEVTYNYEEEGRLVRKEIDRSVLSKGAWATIMFLYQELDRTTEQYREPKIAIVRFKKWNGVYRKQSSFNISSKKQGQQIMEVMEKWYGRVAEGGAEDGAGEEG